MKPEQLSSVSRGAILLVTLMAAAGFGVTVLALYPGYLTNDATFVHSYIKDWRLGDWQSPLMTILWGLIDPIAPGSGSMFLLDAALYWVGFGALAAAVARRSAGLALVVPLLGLTPSAFMLLAMIWRDVLFAVTWLLAATIIYAFDRRVGPLQFLVRALAIVLIGCGILLRPNAIFAAPLLLAYAIWPTGLAWKRTAVMFIPAALAGYGLIHLVYYEILHVKRENPLHSLLVFDLGGITHFSKQNQFPVTWSPDETALLTSRCYSPKLWDTYWTLEPCRFVMARLERPDDLIFGTPRLVQAWLDAVTAHPLGYLEHRLTFQWTFLADANLTLELFRLTGPQESPLARNSYFMALLPLHEGLKSTVLFRVGAWLLLALAIAAFAWPARATRSGAFAVCVTGSGIFYVMSFGVLGVAADFRYGYWCVLASLASLAPALIARREPQRMPALKPASSASRPDSPKGA